MDHFKTVNYGTSLGYVAASVQNDLILPELLQYLFQRWTAFRQRIVDELTEQWRIQTPWFSV